MTTEKKPTKKKAAAKKRPARKRPSKKAPARSKIPPGMVPLTTRVPKQLLVDLKVKCAANSETLQDFCIRKLQQAVA